MWKYRLLFWWNKYFRRRKPDVKNYIYEDD